METSKWRWYIGPRRGDWKKSRRIAKKDLTKELLEPKETKKDPDKLRITGSFVWGPDRLFVPEDNPQVTKG